MLQVFREGEPGRAQVTALRDGAATATAWLSPGKYTVPLAPRTSLEDQALFQSLQEYGLVRLNQA
ncbi:hypothetical protein LP419_01785 [Massilia sp. H-1]|nr:hypothetical protein LP419_01785 [Massilia sp. H-1]